MASDAVASSSLFTEVPGSPFAAGTGATAVTFNSSGSLMAVANSGDNTVSVFTVSAGGMLAAAPGSPFSAGSGVDSVAFSPNGNLLAAANPNAGTVSEWTVAPSGQLTLVPGTPKSVGGGDPVSVAFSRTGTLLATANENPANTVSVFTVGAGGTLALGGTGAPVSIPPFMTADSDPVAVAFSPTADQLAVAEHDDRGLGIYATSPSGALSLERNSYSPGALIDDPVSLAYSPNGQLLAAGLDASRSVAVYSVGSGGALALAGLTTLGTANPPAGVAFSPSGSLLAVGDGLDNAVSVYAAAPNGTLTAGAAVATAADATGVAFSPRGALLAASDAGAGKVSMFSLAPPTARVASPAAGSVFVVGESVATSFSCADSAFGPGISSCVDGNGTSGGTGMLNTATVGPQTYTVTATSLDGQTGATSTNYTVLPPPTASITVPVNGGQYMIGQSVPTRFSCADSAGAPGIESCVDSSGASAPAGKLNTGRAGTFRYAVTATSRDSGVGTTAISYTVWPAATVSRLSSSAASGSLTLSCEAPAGQSCAGQAVASMRGQRVGSASFDVRGGARRTLSLSLNGAGRKLLARSYSLDATITFTGVSLRPMSLRYAYPLVTPRPNASWAGWTWTNRPCRNCYTEVDQQFFFGIPKLSTLAAVTVGCSGHGCPGGRSYKPGHRMLRLNALFNRARLAPGATITLKITAKNSVGRVVSWHMLVGAEPQLRVQCLPPGARRPSTCTGGV